MFLSEIGMVLTEARNGKEAVEIFAESTPSEFDYIFMDIMMPIMNGLEASKQIRTLNRTDANSVPIIAMTANAFAEDKKSCFDAGMTAYITKPLDTETILKTLLEIENPTLHSQKNQDPSC